MVEGENPAPYELAVPSFVDNRAITEERQAYLTEFQQIAPQVGLAAPEAQALLDTVVDCASSFEYVAGVPIFHSRDLVHWHQIGYCLTQPATLTAECSFARHLRPDDRYHNGTFYMIATNVDLLYGSGGRRPLSGSYPQLTPD